MKKITTLLVILSLFTQTALADCPNAVVLHKGDTVTDCDRVGLSDSYEKKVRQDLIESDYNRKVVEEQKKLLDMKDLKYNAQEQQTNLYKSGFDEKDKELQSERSRAKWEFYGGIGVGILISIIGVIAVKKTVQ